ncbi:hypothetical protein EQG41_19715 [Billgrantia azerbaijanica]|nr:hypothetical protein EQG41_19715 [Halomonas azerbaijanica]
MSLILCPVGAIAETIQQRIDAGYTGLCTAIHSQDVGLEDRAGFYPAWQAEGPAGTCTVVPATVGPFPHHPQARSWMRDLLERHREDAA